ncbi:MAG: SUMF1/EgtB/PvdO family nonheme iron enzyme [Deltaproteobacteria bacterium]|nr:SUMF1/EgtB/PvdO family nonheme iron enzyme [Deltaproteobacteria bacterium]
MRRHALFVALLASALCVSCRTGGGSDNAGVPADAPGADEAGPATDVTDYGVEASEVPVEDVPLPDPPPPDEPPDQVVPDPVPDKGADGANDAPANDEGAADACQPACDGAKCGDDGCGGVCGKCSGWEVCREGQCVEFECEPGFVRIPAGEFDMGAPEDEPGTFEYGLERPVHHVTITRPFCMAESETTQAAWESVMGNNPSAPQDGGLPALGGEYPVQCVNLWEALAYCNLLSGKSGLEPCYALEGWDGEGCGGKKAGEGVDCGGLEPKMKCPVTFKGLDCAPNRRVPSAGHAG